MFHLKHVSGFGWGCTLAYLGMNPIAACPVEPTKSVVVTLLLKCNPTAFAARHRLDLFTPLTAPQNPNLNFHSSYQGSWKVCGGVVEGTRVQSSYTVPTLSHLIFKIHTPTECGSSVYSTSLCCHSCNFCVVF